MELLNQLSRVFKLDYSPSDEDESADGNITIQLAPKLARYHATLHYDQSGNANISIYDPSQHRHILDMSLDNGEINEIDLATLN